MIRVKTGVQPELLRIAAAAANVGQEMGLDVVITSGTDGRHKRGSKHYSSAALDLRSKHLHQGQKLAYLAALRLRLGHDYDCLLESLGLANEHFHIEYDPS